MNHLKYLRYIKQDLKILQNIQIKHNDFYSRQHPFSLHLQCKVRLFVLVTKITTFIKLLLKCYGKFNNMKFKIPFKQ